MSRLRYGHAPARSHACGGVTLPLLLLVPALVALGVAVHLWVVTS